MKKIALLLLAIVTIAFSSCTIEKRQYMRGYHVEWKHKAPEVGGNGQASNKELVKSNEEAAVAINEAAQQENVVAVEESTNVVNQQQTTSAVAELKSEKATKKERKEVAKEVKKAIAESKTYTSSSASISASEIPAAAIQKADTPSTGVLVLIAFFIPPLAVYLYEGDWTSRCTTNLILTLLCGLPGFIHALIVILGKK